MDSDRPRHVELGASKPETESLVKDGVKAKQQLDDVAQFWGTATGTEEEQR